MKTVLSLLCSALPGLASAGTQNDRQGISAENPRTARNKDFMAVEITLRPDGSAVPSDRAVLITPRTVNGADSTDLPSIGAYGRPCLAAQRLQPPLRRRRRLLHTPSCDTCSLLFFPDEDNRWSDPHIYINSRKVVLQETTP